MIDACLHRDTLGLCALRPGDCHGEDPVLEACGDLVGLDLSRKTNLPVYRVQVPLTPEVDAAGDFLFLAEVLRNPTDEELDKPCSH